MFTESSRFEMPPLGVLPEFDVEEKRLSAQLASMPHMTPEDDAEMRDVYDSLRRYGRSYQRSYGVQPTEHPARSVHVMTADRYAQASQLHGIGQTRGFYDGRQDVAYVPLPVDDGPSSQLELYYRMAHELGHQMTAGLSAVYSHRDMSPIIVETAADRFARGFLHDAYMPQYDPEAARAIAAQYAGQRTPYDFHGLAVNPSELQSVDPETGYAVATSRFVEVRIVDQAEAMLGVAAATDFRRLTLEARYISQPVTYIAERLGESVRGLLTTDTNQTPPITVLQDLMALSGQPGGV